MLVKGLCAGRLGLGRCIFIGILEDILVVGGGFGSDLGFYIFLDAVFTFLVNEASFMFRKLVFGVLVSLFLVIWSCGDYYEADDMCRFNALVAATEYNRRYPGSEFRFAYGIADEGGYHVEAQVKVNGEWKSLYTDPPVVHVYITDKRDGFFVDRYYTAEEYFDKLKGWGLK